MESFDYSSNKNKSRLLSELRKLNVTVIDARVKDDNEMKPCSKAKCVTGCVCRGSKQSPFGNHDRSITTEDALMLRRKATARLTRMEKGFNSTVVVTENKTLLISDTQYDRKRCCSKKRNTDSAEADDNKCRSLIPPRENCKNSSIVRIESPAKLRVCDANDEESLVSGNGVDSNFLDPTVNKIKTYKYKVKRGRSASSKYLADYFGARPITCRRTIPVPNIYSLINRNRRAEILEFIKHNENQNTTLSLNEHVLRCVYFHHLHTGTKEILNRQNSNH